MKFLKRRNLILGEMLEEDFISESEFNYYGEENILFSNRLIEFIFEKLPELGNSELLLKYILSLKQKE